MIWGRREGLPASLLNVVLSQTEKYLAITIPPSKEVCNSYITKYNPVPVRLQEAIYSANMQFSGHILGLRFSFLKFFLSQ